MASQIKFPKMPKIKVSMPKIPKFKTIKLSKQSRLLKGLTFSKKIRI